MTSSYSPHEQSSARFRVAAEAEFAGATELWATCADVEGFFELPVNPGRLRLTRLIDASVSGPLREVCAGHLRGDKLRSNAYLQVLDLSEETIGEYFMTVFGCTDCTQHPGDQDRYNVTLEVLADAHSPLVKEIWERWRRETPAAKNLWADYRTELRMAWLDVVRTHYQPGRSSDAAPGSRFDLDGRHITDYPGFYCAIGEAVNGPGGYFGGDLEALNDCLNGGFGATIPFTLAWHNSGVASQHLDKPLYGEESLLGQPPSGPEGQEDAVSDADITTPYIEEIFEVLEGKGVTIIRD